MKSILVIGMGRFGIHLARKLEELGNEVMIIDKNEDIINELSEKFTDSLVGDCTKESTIKFIGPNNFDVCFVTIGSGFQDSLEIIALLKDNGAKHIVAKAAKESQERFLKLVGADEVVYPEYEMANRLAYEYSSELTDLVDFSSDFSIAEVDVPEAWIGMTLIEVDCRKKYHINIIAIKEENSTTTYITGDTVFVKNSTMIVTGDKQSLVKFTKTKKRRKKLN